MRLPEHIAHDIDEAEKTPMPILPGDDAPIEMRTEAYRRFCEAELHKAMRLAALRDELYTVAMCSNDVPNWIVATARAAAVAAAIHLATLERRLR